MNDENKKFNAQYNDSIIGYDLDEIDMSSDSYEKDKAFDWSNYNYDPVNIGADLSGFISQIYSVVNDNDIPEFTYLNTEMFIRDLQKTFSTVPINPEDMVYSFYENLSELSNYNKELLQFKQLIDKVYRDEKGFKQDVSLLNKLVVKIVLEQQVFNKGRVDYMKRNQGTFNEFIAEDAFNDMYSNEIKALTNKKNAHETSQFVLVQTGVNKRYRYEILIRDIISDTETRYYRLADNLQNSTEEVLETVDGVAQFEIVTKTNYVNKVRDFYLETERNNHEKFIRNSFELFMIVSFCF